MEHYRKIGTVVEKKGIELIHWIALGIFILSANHLIRLKFISIRISIHQYFIIIILATKAWIIQ